MACMVLSTDATIGSSMNTSIRELIVVAGCAATGKSILIEALLASDRRESISPLGIDDSASWQILDS